MTVIIGALCDADYKTQTGNIILCADRLITWADANNIPLTSNDSGTKIYDLPSGFFLAISANVSRCHHIYTYLYKLMEKRKIMTKDPRIVDQMKQALADAGAYIRLWMREEILDAHSISEREWLQSQKAGEPRGHRTRNIRGCY
jgi:hypothetical protein